VPFRENATAGIKHAIVLGDIIVMEGMVQANVGQKVTPVTLH
jgi:hypothetical protein